LQNLEFSYINGTTETAKPFVKWVGGKSQLLNSLREKYPHNCFKYCEPFIGGGAVLFDVINKFSPKEILINDINSELINAYICIRDNVNQVIYELEALQREYINADDLWRKKLYYFKRKQYNDLIYRNANNLEQAILFIFLNKTCFNGLYRVNSKGLYNVPQGSYKKPNICDKENLVAVSNALQKVEIIKGDYSQCKDFIDKNTFVYIDPPYRPLSKTSYFTSYSKAVFDDNEQIRLQKFIDSITKKGAKVIISNSDPTNTDETDKFFDNIYSNYQIDRISAKRAISCTVAGRGEIRELLISNY